MKILAALDLSDYGYFVLNKAIQTARQQNAKMDIMVVVEDSGYGSNDPDKKQKQQLRLESANNASRSYQQYAINQGIKAKVRIRCGKSAAEEIVKYQKSEDLDLIVLGRRAKSDHSAATLGSVALKVATCATCTVMIVRCMRDSDRRD